METETNPTKKENYVRCKKCGTDVPSNTHKKMTPCKCGAIEIDGCEGYTRVIGNDTDYEFVQK